MSLLIEKILKYKEQGLSNREIARRYLGASSKESTIRSALKRHFNKNSPEELKQETFGYTKAKILFYDLETAPLKSYLFSMWQNGVGLNQIETDWYLMSFTAKWADSDEVIYMDIRDKYDQEDDTELLKVLWKLLNEADIVIGHNIKRFDNKKLNARFILNGMEPPSTYRSIDTLQIAKALFGFTSNKLEYLTDKLCTVYKKSKHTKFPGFELWAECLKGNIEAWEEMEEYNKFDVLSNQELYEVLMPWDKTLPNFDVYIDEEIDISEWIEDGYHYTNLGKYQRYRNKVTGQQRRGRTNLLTKEKRKSLLANIV